MCKMSHGNSKDGDPDSVFTDMLGNGFYYDVNLECEFKTTDTWFIATANYEEDIALKINENFIIKDAFENSYEFSVKKYLKKFISDGYSKLLDKIYFFEVIREKFNYEDSLEIDLINKYQILVNDLFETFDDENYLVFLALVTDENLRNKFKKNIDS